jgi:hypothetical protein
MDNVENTAKNESTAIETRQCILLVLLLNKKGL